MKNSKIKIIGLTVLIVLIYLIIVKLFEGSLVDYCSTLFVVFILVLLIGVKLKASSNPYNKIIGFSLIYSIIFLMTYLLILFFNAFSNIRC